MELEAHEGLCCSSSQYPNGRVIDSFGGKVGGKVHAYWLMGVTKCV